METIKERSIVSVIKTEAEYQELLLLLVKDYDAKYFKFDPIDPVDAILFRMDQQGLTRNDLIPYLGSSSKVSEVLNRKRPLSLRMIRALHAGLGIPLEILRERQLDGTIDQHMLYCSNASYVSPGQLQSPTVAYISPLSSDIRLYASIFESGRVWLY